MPGATHAAESPSAFDAITILLGDKASAADIAMATTMSDYWAAFVKTGDPSGEGRLAWPLFDPASGEVLNFTNKDQEHSSQLRSPASGK